MSHLEYCSNCGSKNVSGLKDGHRRQYCPNCGVIHYENPIPTATLICPRGNDLLLVRRALSPAKGEWSLPGGFMERGETPEMAAVRELHEETNLTGKPLRFLGYCSHFNTVFGDVLLLGLLMQIDSYEGMKAGDDAAEIGFFPMQTLPRLAFPCHEKIVRFYLESSDEK
ncbi:MAG: NUDIX hydrolase [FCB group bacterium]|nr:NUDIX hydrolase [FCB group bacterium]